MSNSRKYRRKVEQTHKRNDYEVRELDDDDLEAMMVDWKHLTDDTVRALIDSNQWGDAVANHANAEIALIAEKYGVMALAAGPIGASLLLATHVLAHKANLGDVSAAFDRVSNLHRPSRKAGAERIAAAIISDAAGLSGMAYHSIPELFEALGEDAGPVLIGVWQAFCWLGTEAGIGVELCDYHCDAPADETLAGDLDDMERAVGLALGLLACLASGDEETAERLARSVSEFDVEAATAACFGALQAPDGDDVLSASRTARQEVDATLLETLGMTLTTEGDVADVDGAIAETLLSLAQRALAASRDGISGSKPNLAARLDDRIGTLRETVRP